jgi:hypothetical protein
MLNLPLMQIYPTPDSLQIAQKQIENQLLSFKDSLWVQSDTATVALSKKEQKKVSRSVAKTEKGATNDDKKATTKEKAPKEKKSTQSTKSAPTRSIRRS